MSLDASHVFKSYSNSGSAACDVTINLKDLKALVGLCVELGADVVLKFDEAGVPLLAVPHAPGVQVSDCGRGGGQRLALCQEKKRVRVLVCPQVLCRGIGRRLDL